MSKTPAEAEGKKSCLRHSLTVLTAVLRFPKNLHVKIEASAKPSPIAYSCVRLFLYLGNSRLANVCHHTRLVALTHSHHLFGAREIN